MSREDISNSIPYRISRPSTDHRGARSSSTSYRHVQHRPSPYVARIIFPPQPSYRAAPHDLPRNHCIQRHDRPASHPCRPRRSIHADAESRDLQNPNPRLRRPLPNPGFPCGLPLIGYSTKSRDSSDNHALNAGRAARRLLLSKLDPSKNESELKARLDNLIRLKASNEVVKREQVAYDAAVKGKVATDKEATQDFERAKSTFGDAIKSRITSHTYQAQEATNRLSDQAQEATPQEAPQAQGTDGHEAPRPQDLADQKASLLQEAADLKEGSPCSRKSRTGRSPSSSGCSTRSSGCSTTSSRGARI